MTRTLSEAYRAFVMGEIDSRAVLNEPTKDLEHACRVDDFCKTVSRHRTAESSDHAGFYAI